MCQWLELKLCSVPCRCPEQDETGASLTVKEEPEELKIPQKQNPFIHVIVKSEDEEEEPFFQETLDFENSSDTDDSGESSTAQTEQLQEPDIVKNPHKCPVCGKVLQYSQNLKQHMLLHTGQRPYMCTVCGKDYTHVGHLRTHMRTHTGERPYSCSVCEKTFSVRDNLKSHMRTHTGEKPFRCSICDKSYTQNGNLQSHMRSHVGEKPFRCLICNKQFTQKYNLKKHVKRHTESPEGHHYKNDQEQTEEESDGTATTGVRF
uniref:C2H2-type domain-containing protein n=1 Tax=Neogobius melanostomus TaxID=47308 RepID=A0A8C6TXL3_9GOBI